MSVRQHLSLNIHKACGRGRTPVALTLTTIILLTALTLSAQALLAQDVTTEQPEPAPASEAAITANPQDTQAVQGTPANDRLTVELITLRPFGFEPAEISRPQGRFLLAINNRTGLQEIDLQLNHETGNRLRQMRKPKGRHDWRELLDLPPGRYILTEANHKNWVCKITITPR